MSLYSHTGYTCIACGHVYSADDYRLTCEKCGENLDADFDYDMIASRWSKELLRQNRDQSIWRYLPLLPVHQKPDNLSIKVGGTPIVQANTWADKMGIKQLWFKDDTRNPSGSLKDRATEVGIQHAKELGFRKIVAASTGNAAASLACLSAFHDMDTIVIAPKSAPPAKLTQILQYGAQLYPVEGNYDAAFDLATEIAEEMNWYIRSSGINPILSEGKKTVALEIADQLNWNVPDQVFVPVGDGCIIGGVYKGFYDLQQLGWFDRIPKINAIQAQGSAAIVNALDEAKITKVQAHTIADGVSVDYPRDGQKALRAVRNSGGYGITVSDSDILDAQKALSTSVGLFAEPAAACAFAGLLAALENGQIGKHESAVVLITGSGLKDIPSAQKRITIPNAIPADFSSFKELLKIYNG